MQLEPVTHKQDKITKVKSLLHAAAKYRQKFRNTVVVQNVTTKCHYKLLLQIRTRLMQYFLYFCFLPVVYTVNILCIEYINLVLMHVNTFCKGFVIILSLRDTLVLLSIT